jgi:hypothetical protein
LVQTFFNSPENRKSNTVIEFISAGSSFLPLFIIIKGSRIIDNWFLNNLYNETTIITSNSGYSNNKIGIKVLEHFIKCTNLSSWSSLISLSVPKLLLFDRHSSYCTDEFKVLATQNNIIFYQFPAYLTYIIQPLDIGCFYIWKYFYNLAIYKLLHNLQNTYNSAVFLRDLSVIWIKTLTLSNIVSVFQKSGIWLPDIYIILKKIKRYSISKPSPTRAPNSDSELPVLSSLKSIFKSTPSNAFETVKVGKV